MRGSDGLVDDIISHPRNVRLLPGSFVVHPSSIQSACSRPYRLTLSIKPYNDHVTRRKQPNLPVSAPRTRYRSGHWPLAMHPDALSVGYVQDFVVNDPTWNWTDFSYETVLTAERLNVDESDARDSNISDFHNRGDKLLSIMAMLMDLSRLAAELTTTSTCFELSPSRIALDDWYHLLGAPRTENAALRWQVSTNNALWCFAAARQASRLARGTYAASRFVDA